MKILMATAFVITLAADGCDKKAKDGVYKARLDIKALCMNYTFSLIEGEIDTAMVMPSWTDESTGKSYSNAFGIANPCNFPSSIQQGDEFYFTIDTARQKNCAVCMAYYPTPSKKVAIRVVEK